VGALIVVAAATAGLVVLSALTSWWVLFALFGVFPLLMMAGCRAMTGMGRPMGGGLCTAGPCGSWLRSDGGHATSAD
jgi:hypothetical protein